MSDMMMYLLIKAVGDDAKTILLVHVVLSHTLTLVAIGLVTWGVRTLWRKREEWHL